LLPVISFSSEAEKMTDATSSVLAERAPWRRGRNTQFNLTLNADILVPFRTFARTQRVSFGALLGQVLDEVEV